MPDIKMLQELQSYPLDMKVWLTKQRIREWIQEYGESGVYVSFSGGKDSTVLLDIVRQDYPEVPALFCNTGVEHAEIVRFVKTFDNVEIRRPKMSYKQVIEKYGYPVISKEVSECAEGARKYVKELDKQMQENTILTDRQTGHTTDIITTSCKVKENTPRNLVGGVQNDSNVQETVRTGRVRIPYTFEYQKLTGTGNYMRIQSGGGNSRLQRLLGTWQGSQNFIDRRNAVEGSGSFRKAEQREHDDSGEYP